MIIKQCIETLKEAFPEAIIIYADDFDLHIDRCETIYLLNFDMSKKEKLSEVISELQDKLLYPNAYYCVNFLRYNKKDANKYFADVIKKYLEREKNEMSKLRKKM